MTEEIDFSRVRITRAGRELVEKYRETGFKPCPFCGAKPEKSGYLWFKKDGEEVWRYNITCPTCHVHFTSMRVDNVAEKWNRRSYE